MVLTHVDFWSPETRYLEEVDLACLAMATRRRSRLQSSRTPPLFGARAVADAVGLDGREVLAMIDTGRADVVATYGHRRT